MMMVNMKMVTFTTLGTTGQRFPLEHEEGEAEGVEREVLRALAAGNGMALAGVGAVAPLLVLLHQASVTLLKTGVDECGLQGFGRPVSSSLPSSVSSSVYQVLP